MTTKLTNPIPASQCPPSDYPHTQSPNLTNDSTLRVNRGHCISPESHIPVDHRKQPKPLHHLYGLLLRHRGLESSYIAGRPKDHEQGVAVVWPLRAAIGLLPSLILIIELRVGPVARVAVFPDEHGAS